VWTANACSGFLGVFNVQGASWDRDLRQFRTHDPSPPQLTAPCRPADVETAAHLAAAAPGEPSGRFATLTRGAGAVHVGALWDALQVAVAPASADLLTIVPLASLGGVDFAPFGFAAMLNTGGSVTAWAVERGGGGRNGGGGALTHRVDVRGEGVFAAYASCRPSAVQVDGAIVDAAAVTWDSASSRLGVDVPATGESVQHVLRLSFPSA